MRGEESRTTPVLVVTVAALMVFVLFPLAGSASATPGIVASGANAWAYGGVKLLNINTPTSNGSASGSAYYGQATVLSQNAGPNGNFSVQAQHTTGAGVDINYCSPSCSSPTYYEIVWNYRVWENVTDFANFTNDATVSTPGGSTAALGLLDSHSLVVANLTEYLGVELHGLRATSSYARTLSIELAGTASVAFPASNPLGLVPSDVGSVASWTSTAPYSAAWSWSASYYNHTLGAGSTPVNQTTFSGNGTVPNGTVNLSGVNEGTAITLGGKSLLVLAISISGAPFDLRDGFILLPASTDLFGTARHAWTPSQSGTTTTQLANVDYATTSSGHVGILATRQVYSSSPSATGASGIGAIVDAQPPGVPMLQQVGVQGQPESVNQAAQNEQCLAVGSCSAPSGPASPLREIFGVLAVTILVAIVIAVVVQRRRQLPSPVYPNAQLYPIGAPLTAIPAEPRRPADPEKEPEPDPLGNLW